MALPSHRPSVLNTLTKLRARNAFSMDCVFTYMIRTNPTLNQGAPALISKGKKWFLLNLNTGNPSSCEWKDEEAGRNIVN